MKNARKSLAGVAGFELGNAVVDAPFEISRQFAEYLVTIFRHKLRDLDARRSAVGTREELGGRPSGGRGPATPLIQ
jgi:hypothetical protein